MSKAIDYTGMRFGRLVAQHLAETTGKRRSWECVCDCGKTRVVQANNLQSGNTTSCGCSHIGKKRPNRKKPRRDLGRLGMKPRHGHACGYTKTPEYATWDAMNKRCANPNCPSWERYGGRGITVCDRWRDSFENFLADMGPRPSDGHSIDRIDNEGGYSPDNCRWATRKEQARNTRVNRMVTWSGETMPLAAWADRLQIPRAVLQHRLDRGWDVDRAFTQVAQVHRIVGLTSLRFNLLRAA